jgi:hypothetical protein
MPYLPIKESLSSHYTAETAEKRENSGYIAALNTDKNKPRKDRS